MIKHLTKIRELFSESNIKDGYLTGTINSLEKEHIKVIMEVKDYLDSIYDENDDLVRLNMLPSYIAKSISLKINIGSVDNYFENFNDFLKRYGFEKPKTEFHIYEEKINEKTVSSDIYNAYLDCIQLIELLKNLCGSQNRIGNDFELYFFNSGKSLQLNLSYTKEDLINLTVTDIDKVYTDIFEGINNEDRKEIFVNNLVDFFQFRPNNLSQLIKSWNVFLRNYNHSYKAFLEGFSFEKIQNSSNDYFQEVKNKIHETIRKVSNYLFAIPVSFLFLASRLDFNPGGYVKNIALFIMGCLFSILIWKIFFKNIKESLDSIRTDLESYQNKIDKIEWLKDVRVSLSNLKNIDLENQYNKLKWIEGITILFLLLLGVTIIEIEFGFINDYILKFF